MAQQPQRPPGPTCAYVDLPELSETLADSVHSLLFDGQTLRITFAVTEWTPLTQQIKAPADTIRYADLC